MKTIYLFSGLGADRRMFEFLEFQGYNTIFINWITPEKYETIENYAKRLISQIATPQPILIGLSFGGMIAIEVAKIIETEKIILLASAKTRNEVPVYFRIAGYLKLHTLLPGAVLKQSNFMTYWLFGAKTDFEKKLLKDILYDTDSKFLIWAINQIVYWQNATRHKNLIHIHGTADKILPIGRLQSDVNVKGGGHFMTINKADELNEIIKKFLP